MNCAEFEAQLQQLLDERTPLAELPQPLREAAANDPACGQILQAYQALEAGMKARPLPQPPANLAASVLARLAEPTQGSEADDAFLDDWEANLAAAPQEASATRGDRKWVLVWSVAAVAASLLIAVVFVARESANDETSPGQLAGQPDQNSVAEQALPRDEDQPSPEGPQSSPSAFASLSELALRQYESLAAEAKASLADVAVLVPQYELGSVEVVAAPTADEADSSVDRPGPFKQSTRGAFGLLMRFTPQ